MLPSRDMPLQIPKHDQVHFKIFTSHVCHVSPYSNLHSSSSYYHKLCNENQIHKLCQDRASLDFLCLLIAPFLCLCRMAIDVADSQYLLILAPSLVIILMFLFFWLFMKETSYDEVLARQKRDLKLPPVKTDARKKGEKKKNKKKENTGNEGGGGKGSESQDDLQDFDLVDATSSTLNNEVPEVVPVPLPVSVPVQSEPPTRVRERKKKEKKAKTAASASVATAAPPPAPVTTEKPEVNGSKPAVRKEQTVPLSKQPSPPQAQAPPPAPSPVETTGKKKAKKQKSETGKM